MRLIALLALSLTLVGCPVGIKVIIENSSKFDVSIVHDYMGEDKTFLQAGKAVEFTHRSSCIYLEVNGAIHTFHFPEVSDYTSSFEEKGFVELILTDATELSLASDGEIIKALNSDCVE